MIAQTTAGLPQGVNRERVELITWQGEHNGQRIVMTEHHVIWLEKVPESCAHDGLKRYCGKDVYCEQCKSGISEKGKPEKQEEDEPMI